MRVLKFGGAALGDAAAIANSCGYVVERGGRPVVVVVSAMRGVTDLLHEALDRAGRGDKAVAAEVLAELRAKHAAAAEELLTAGETRRCFLDALGSRARELEGILVSIATLGEVTPRSFDWVVSFGERLAARLVAATLRDRGTAAVPVDGEEVVVTDGRFGNAYPDLEASRARIRARLLPLCEEGAVPVVMGYAGAGPDGATTTLGRGGTDLSASVLGHALDAEEVRFMKEVDGIMSADPRVVPDARRLDELTYTEVAELSFFGAKVLHPIAIHPLDEKRIPARICDVTAWDAPGTRVVHEEHAEEAGAKAVTAIPDVAILAVEGGGMQGVPGMAGRVFTATAAAEVNVLMISQSSSEQNICLVVPASDRARAVAALEAALELEILKGKIEPVAAIDGLTVVAAVGHGMRGQPGIAGRLFSALGDAAINVRLIAQGSSELNVSFVVAREDAARALRVIHDAFEMGTR